MTEDLMKYPAGKFVPPASYTTDDLHRWINDIKVLPGKMRQAVISLNEKQLDTQYRTGGWTLRQVVHHVADSHANAYVRFKLALTEDWPTIKPYEQAAWANLFDSQALPVKVSLDMLVPLHLRWVTLLESLSEEDFQRGYVHPENGRQNLAQVLAMYKWHSDHHTAHITNLRQRMGW